MDNSATTNSRWRIRAVTLSLLVASVFDVAMAFTQNMPIIHF